MPSALPTGQSTLHDFGLAPAPSLQTDPPTYLSPANSLPSTEQTTIANTPDPLPKRPSVYVLPGEQAELDAFDPEEPAWTPTPNPTRSCDLCGSAVGPSFARINRDADGKIRGCPHCDQTEASRTDRWGTYEAIGDGELFADGGKDGVVYDTKPERERTPPTYGDAACCLTCGEEQSAEKMGCHLVETHPEQANRILQANA